MRKLARLAFTILLIVLFNSLLSAADDPYLIHSSGISYWPVIAIDPESGSTGLVWASYNDETGIREIYFQVIRIDEKGHFEKLQKKLIGYGGDYGNITFNSRKKEFFVTWNVGKWWDSSLRSRIFDKNGQPTTGTIEYDPAGHPNVYPNVTYNSQNNTYILIWCRGDRGSFNTSEPGLVAATLNDRGRFKSNPKIIRGVIDSYSYQWPTEAIAVAHNEVSNRVFVLVREDKVVNYNNDKTKGSYYIYNLDTHGNLQSKKKVNNGEISPQNFGWYAGISNNDNTRQAHHLTVWQQSNKVHYSVISKNGSTTVKDRLIQNVNFGDHPAAAYSPVEDKYLVVFKSGRGVVGVHINSKGQQEENRPFKISKSRLGRVPRVAWHEKSNSFFVVWSQEVNANNDKLYALLVD